MADWMNVPYLQSAYGGAAPARMRLAHPSIAPYGAFACADGRQVRLSVQSDREWILLAGAVLGRPELGTDPRFASNVARVAHRAELDGLIAPVVATMDRETAMARLGGAGIACGRMSGLEDLQTHPHAHRIRVDSPTGPVEMMGRGVSFAGGGIGYGPVPALGEHGAALRQEFGASP